MRFLLAATLLLFLPVAFAQFTSYLPRYELKQPLEPLTKLREIELTKKTLEASLPDFIKRLVFDLSDTEREATLRSYLREVNSTRCGEDIIASFALLAASLVVPTLAPPAWLLHSKFLFVSTHFSAVSSSALVIKT